MGWGRTRHQTRLDLKGLLRGTPGLPASGSLWERIVDSIRPTTNTDNVKIPYLIVQTLLRLANNGADVDPPTSGASLEIQRVDYNFGADPGSGTWSDLALGNGFLIHLNGFTGASYPVTINSIASSTGGEQAYLIVNDCGQTVTLKDETGGTAQNQIRTPGQVDLVLQPGAPGSNTVLLFRIKFPSGPTATRWVACPLNLSVDRRTRLGIGAAPDSTAPLRVFGGEVLQETAANGAVWKRGYATELVTIAAAASSDSAADLLPASSIIEAVVVRVTVAIPTATLFDVGTSASSMRFARNVAVAANTTATGIDQWLGSVTTAANGPTQGIAAKVRITPDATPANGDGRVRVTVFYRTFTPPTS